jgi:hypothetical protein
MGAVIRRIRNFVAGAFGLFIAVGFLPIFGAGIAANLLGYKTLAEYLIVFGLGGWIAIRWAFGWLMERSWRRSDDGGRGPTCHGATAN